MQSCKRWRQQAAAESAGRRPAALRRACRQPEQAGCRLGYPVLTWPQCGPARAHHCLRWAKQVQCVWCSAASQPKLIAFMKLHIICQLCGTSGGTVTVAVRTQALHAAAIAALLERGRRGTAGRLSRAGPAPRQPLGAAAADPAAEPGPSRSPPPAGAGAPHSSSPAPTAARAMGLLATHGMRWLAAIMVLLAAGGASRPTHSPLPWSCQAAQHCGGCGGVAARAVGGCGGRRLRFSGGSRRCSCGGQSHCWAHCSRSEPSG